METKDTVNTLVVHTVLLLVHENKTNLCIRAAAAALTGEFIDILVSVFFFVSIWKKKVRKLCLASDRSLTPVC